jgi:hypothetical protein
MENNDTSEVTAPLPYIPVHSSEPEICACHMQGKWLYLYYWIAFILLKEDSAPWN